MEGRVEKNTVRSRIVEGIYGKGLECHVEGRSLVNSSMNAGVIVVNKWIVERLKDGIFRMVLFRAFIIRLIDKQLSL